MCGDYEDWGFGRFFTGGFGPRVWAVCGPGGGRRHRRARQQIFESGEMKYVILQLIKEKPRHGYEVIKALEEKLGGWYTASAGTVYPTLQLLEDQGYVRAVESEGKRIYHITPEGETFLAGHRDVLEEVMERVRGAVHGFAGGAVGELGQAFGQLAKVTFDEAWRLGPGHPRVKRIIEILQRAAQDVEAAKAAAP